MESDDTDIDDWARASIKPPTRDAAVLAEGSMFWPAGHRSVRANDVRYLLARSARWHARLAIEKLSSRDLDELLQAAVSAGTAMELIAKTYLATISPSLLRGDHRDLHTGVMLAGRSSSPDRPPTSMRSISAADSFKAVENLNREIPRNAVSSAAVRARNAALHMGLVDALELETAVTFMARYVEVLVSLLELDRERFWGEHAAVAVTSLISERESELARQVDLRRVAAWKIYQDRTKELDPAARVVMITAMVATKPRYAEFERHERCPVCESDSWLSMTVQDGPIEAEYDKEGGVEGAFVTRTAYPVRFYCPVCTFELDEEEFALPEFEELRGPFGLDPVEASYYYSDYYEETV